MNWWVRGIKKFAEFWITWKTYFSFYSYYICSHFSISAFASQVGILVGIASSAVGLKYCVITAEVKKYKSIIKKEKEKHHKIGLLEKSILNSTEVLTSKASVDSKISHGEFISVNNVLKEYDVWKKKSTIVTINKRT